MSFIARAGGWAFCGVILLASLCLHHAQPAEPPAIQITPKEPLMDEPVVIRVTGLPAGQRVTLRAMQEGPTTWRAEALFETRADGTLDLSLQAPISGSYSGIDGMGLFWSMTAVPPDPARGPRDGEKPKPRSISDPRPTRFEAEVEGKIVASTVLTRWLARPGVKISDVREQGLVGKLFEPAASGKHPAMLVLSGSEGGIPETEAALLASRGFTSLALAYFGVAPLPQQLINIPLDYLKQGIDWLKQRDSVDGARLGVIGGSKGGELALLLGATFPEIRAVVAKVPSHVVWAGIPRGPMAMSSSWKHRGEPLPFLPFSFNVNVFRKMGGPDPVALLDLYAPALKNEHAVAKAVIPVEKINGPILLISGTDDQMWPSTEMADKVAARLKQHSFAHAVEHLKYAGAGHGIVSVYMPMAATLSGGKFLMGGSAEANARAQADSRAKTLAFLAQALR